MPRCWLIIHDTKHATTEPRVRLGRNAGVLWLERDAARVIEESGILSD